MEKSLIHSVVMFPTCDKAPVISEPGNRALNFPTAFVPSKGTTILGLWLPAIASMRDHKLNALFFKFAAKFVRVISFVTNQMLGLLANLFKSLIGKFHLRRNGTKFTRGFGKILKGIIGAGILRMLNMRLTGILILQTIRDTERVYTQMVASRLGEKKVNEGQNQENLDIKGPRIVVRK